MKIKNCFQALGSLSNLPGKSLGNEAVNRAPVPSLRAYLSDIQANRSVDFHYD